MQPSGFSAWHHRRVDAVRSISSPAHLHHVSAVTVIRIMQVLLDSDIFVLVFFRGFFAFYYACEGFRGEERKPLGFKENPVVILKKRVMEEKHVAAKTQR